MSKPLESLGPPHRAIFLVCKACRKRRNGPADVKPKKLAGELQRAARGQGTKARVLLTDCQGVCPKGATTVTDWRPGSQAQLWVVHALGQADEVIG